MTSFLLPDTLSISKAENSRRRSIDDQEIAATPPATGTSIIQVSLHQAREGLREIRSFLGGHGLVIVIMFSYVFVATSKVVQVMLLQYTSKRYEFSWSKVSHL
jgi:hypothetical protein